MSAMNAMSSVRRRVPAAGQRAPVRPSGRVSQNIRLAMGRPTRASASEMPERRRTDSTRLVLACTDSFCVMRNFSAHAVSGFHSSTSMSSTTMTMVTMAHSTLPSCSCSDATATKLPRPGSAYVLLFTEIISEAVRKNQPPPTLIMQFHSSGIIEFGTSSFQKRCQRVSCMERAASSNSCGSLSSEW